jgi:hypothetical protein
MTSEATALSTIPKPDVILPASVAKSGCICFQEEFLRMKIKCVGVVSVLVLSVLSTVASAQTGPVATGCKEDIAKLCQGKPHDGEVRICLETNYDKVSSACKKALDTTGGGRGQGLYGKRK